MLVHNPFQYYHYTLFLIFWHLLYIFLGLGCDYLFFLIQYNNRHLNLFRLYFFHQLQEIHVIRQQISILFDYLSVTVYNIQNHFQILNYIYQISMYLVKQYYHGFHHQHQKLINIHSYHMLIPVLLFYFFQNHSIHVRVILLECFSFQKNS